MIAFIIVSSLMTLIVTKPVPTVPPKDCFSGNITGVATLENGTVFVASDQFYWLLNNKTLDLINNQSKGLIKDLIPGMNSVQMAVSLRVSVNKSKVETIVFQTFEDNRHKLMAYTNKRWGDGLPILRQYMDMIFNRSLSFDSSDNKKRLILLYFTYLGNPTVFVSYGEKRNAINIPWILHLNWTHINAMRNGLLDIADKTFNSLWVRDPESFTLSYLVFVGHQYYECKVVLSASNQTKDVCDSKKNISQLFKCLPSVVPNPLQSSEVSKTNQGFKNTFILVIAIILVISVVILIVVIIVYCKCLKQMIALESETKSLNPKTDDSNGKPQGKPIAVEPKEEDKKEEEKVVHEPIDMAATVNRMKDILGRKKKDETPPPPPPPPPEKSKKSQKERKHHKTKDKGKDKSSQKTPKKSKKAKKSEEEEEDEGKGTEKLTSKQSDKFQKNVKEIGKMLSEGPNKSKHKTIKPQPEVDSQIEDKKTKVLSEVKERPEPQPSRVEQTSDDRLRQLFSQAPGPQRRTTDDEDRVGQLLNQSKMGAPSKQDSRVGKLFKE